MSSGAESTDFEGQKMAAAASLQEKPSFSQKCSLLSQYLKKKGSFADLPHGMTCNIESNENGTPGVATAMNLFPVIEKPYDAQTRNMGSLWNLRPMDLFPQQAGFTSSAFKEDTQQKINSSVNNPETQTAQMTIFYGGKVFVFDDIPADKAKEIIHLPSKGRSKSHIAFPPAPAKRHAVCASEIVGSPIIQVHVQAPRQPLAGDLPIARRASLHRFLQKRKDRVAARAPYQTASTSASLAKSAESNSWLGLTVQSRH